MNVMLLFLSFFNFLFIVIEAYYHYQPGYDSPYKTPSPPAAVTQGYSPPDSPQPGFSNPSPQRQVERERSRSPPPQERQTGRRRQSVQRTATTNTRTATTARTARTARAASVVVPDTKVELFKILDSNRDGIVTWANYQSVKDGTIYNNPEVKRVLAAAFSQGSTLGEEMFPKFSVDLKSLNGGMGFNRVALKEFFGFSDEQVSKMLTARAFTPPELAEFFNKKTTRFD